MTRDKNEEERQRLTREILLLEEREEEAASLKRRYEANLEKFYSRMQQLSLRQEEILQSDGARASNHHIREIEDNQRLRQHMNRYIDETYTELENIYSKFRRFTNDEYDRLLTERSQLPWE